MVRSVMERLRVRPRYVLMPAALLLVAGGVYFWIANTWEAGDASATPEAISAGPATPAPAARRGGREQKFDSRKHLFSPDVVQVAVAPVRQTDFPTYLSGLGTVYAYNTVDTMAQVDGVIQQMKFVEGQDVKIGDPLVILDATPYQAKVEQFQGLKAKAEAALANAKSNLWRDQQLLSHNFVSQKVTDGEQALVDQYTAEVAEYGAEIKYWQAQVDFTMIRSPINGRTGIRHVDPGNLIRAQQHVNIVTVTQMQPISVIITLPSKLLAETGNSPGISSLPVLAYSQNGRTLLDRGQLVAVDNEVDVATGTIKLKAEFPNAKYKLWPGDYVDCRIEVDKGQGALTIPVAAVRHGANGDFVWLVKPDGTAEHRRVTVKQTRGDTALIERGLAPTDRVVTEGQYHLQPGSRIEVVNKVDDREAEISGE